MGQPRDQFNWMMDTAENAAPVATLLENHRAFLRYLERRVGDRALAEDILQDAFAKVVARARSGARWRSGRPVVLSDPTKCSYRSVPS